MAYGNLISVSLTQSRWKAATNTCDRRSRGSVALSGDGWENAEPSGDVGPEGRLRTSKVDSKGTITLLDVTDSVLDQRSGLLGLAAWQCG